MRAPALFLTFSLSAPALAQDYSAEAKRRMNLSFDLDEVNDQLQAPWPAPALPGHGQVSALPLEPNSEIDTITVFQDRALVTRILKAEVESGEASLTFEGLPLGIQTETFYATLLDGDGRIIGVEVESGQGEVEEMELMY